MTSKLSPEVIKQFVSGEGDIKTMIKKRKILEKIVKIKMVVLKKIKIVNKILL